MRPYHQHFRPILSTTLAIIAVAIGATTLVAQERPRRLPAAKITIDEDILAALVDEPCQHFESALEQYVAGNSMRAGELLRTATAFLRLEAARSTPEGQAALESSIAELGQLASSVENKRIDDARALKQAFVRAHYALAGHHCIKSAHRCCRPATFQNRQEQARTGRDLNAAISHLNKGLYWAGEKPDEETRDVIERSQRTARKLTRQGGVSQTKARNVIHAIHERLEKISGLKIMLASPLAADSKAGPSIVR